MLGYFTLTAPDHIRKFSDRIAGGKQRFARASLGSHRVLPQSTNRIHPNATANRTVEH